MRNWMKVFSTKTEFNKKPYKTENGQELQNQAEFTGDKFPKSGDPAKIELNAWHKDNAAMGASKKKEDKSVDHGSALMSEKSRDRNVDAKLKEEHVIPNYAKKDIKTEEFLSKKAVALLRCPSCGHEANMYKFGIYMVGRDTNARCPMCEHEFDYNEGEPENIQSYVDPGPKGRKFSPLSAILKKSSTWRNILSSDLKTVPFKCPKCGHEADALNFKHYQGSRTDFICPSCNKVSNENELNPSGVKPAGWSDKYGSWRNIFSDLSFKQKPSGELQIDVTQSGIPGAPQQVQPQPQVQPPPVQPTDETEQKESSVKEASFVGMIVRHITDGVKAKVMKEKGEELYVRTEDGKTAVWSKDEVNQASVNPRTTPNYARKINAMPPGSSSGESLEPGEKDIIAISDCPDKDDNIWLISKRGSLQLLGEECEKNVYVTIQNDVGEPIEKLQVVKNGHTWRELINQAEWEAKLEKYAEIEKK